VALRPHLSMGLPCTVSRNYAEEAAKRSSAPPLTPGQGAPTTGLCRAHSSPSVFPYPGRSRTSKSGRKPRCPLTEQVRTSLPEEQQSHLLSASYRDDTLSVTMDSAAWCPQVRYAADRLLERLQANGGPEFARLKVRVGRRGNVSSGRTGKASRREARRGGNGLRPSPLRRRRKSGRLRHLERHQLPRRPRPRCRRAAACC
jgi:hypothetical protein